MKAFKAAQDRTCDPIFSDPVSERILKRCRWRELMRMLVFAACLLFGVCIVVPAVAYQKELSDAAAFLAEKIAAGPRHQVAVVGFTDLQGNVTELGRFIAEEVALGLVRSNQPILVIDRTHLLARLQDKLASLGGIDPAAARELGETAVVDTLVTGTITPLSDSVHLVLKVLDANTARILVASSVDIAKTGAIEELTARIRSAYLSPTSDALGSGVAPPISPRDTVQNDVLRMFTGAKGGSPSVSTQDRGQAVPVKKPFVFHGKVEAVDKSAKSLSVSSERIEGWMDAMTMIYPVDDPSTLDKLEPGDQIMATVYDGDYSLHKIEIMRKSTRSESKE